MSSKEQPSYSDKSMWQKRTKFEKILLILFTLAILGTIFLSVTLIRKYPFGFRDSRICQTEGCVTSAARIIKNMNQDADPCDDFYEFACGRYTQNTQIPEDEVDVTSFDEVRNQVMANYRILLEEPIQDDEMIPIQYTKKLYGMCMNSSDYEEQDFKFFKKMLKDLGGWPVLEGNNWNEKDFDWRATQYSFRKMGLYNTQLISSYVGLDAKNSTKKIFEIGQPCGGLVKIFKNGFNETIVKAYYEFLVDLAILYGADKVQASRDIMQYMEFRIEMAKIITPAEERRNMSLEYNPMTIRELQVSFPSIPWLQYINTKLEPFVTLTYDDIVIVTLPQYLEKLEKLLAVTPKRAIANYLFISILEYREFNDEMRKNRLDYDKVAYGVTSETPKWKSCIYSGLYYARSSMYVRRFLKSKSKTLMTHLVTDIKETFMENLKKYTWMDHKTKKKAMQKAEEMRSYVGYPEELLDDDLIRKEYEGLVINEESPLKTYLAMTIWYRNEYLKKYYEPYDKNDWKNNAFPTTVNAFYDATVNSIKIPSGILHPPFFDKDRPQYMNYGAIGYIVGHEIIHGFDDEGRQFDKEGNLVNWWEPASNKSFYEKAQCIVEQYGNHTNEKINMTLNGVLTQGENIADNGGIKMAYISYQKWLARNKPEPSLPGLKYSPEQMFWISAANNWCSKVRPQMEKLQILHGVHSPHYYRAIIPFINSGFFAKDFNCPLGSKMNPKQKCRLW